MVLRAGGCPNATVGDAVVGSVDMNGSSSFFCPSLVSGLLASQVYIIEVCPLGVGSFPLLLLLVHLWYPFVPRMSWDSQEKV